MQLTYKNLLTYIYANFDKYKKSGSIDSAAFTWAIFKRFKIETSSNEIKLRVFKSILFVVHAFAEMWKTIFSAKATVIQKDVAWKNLTIVNPPDISVVLTRVGQDDGYIRDFWKHVG